MKRCAIVIITILLSNTSHAQCPDKDFLWHRIIFLRDSSKIEKADQLDELLGYEKKAKICGFQNDSVHVFLLQRIGWLFTSKKDFFNAIEYTKKSIALVNQQRGSLTINPASNIKSYWNLHFMYDSLNLKTKAIAAVDSCISNTVYLKKGYDYTANAVPLILAHLFNIGDYVRCIQYATLGESLLHEGDVVSAAAQEITSRYYLNKKINSLFALGRNDEAASILIDQIAIAEKKRMDSSLAYSLANLYGLYASVLIGRGRTIEAIASYKKCYSYSRLANYREGCAEALDNIGFTYSRSLHQNKMALPYHFKALKFANANESMNIYDNIAGVYEQYGKYDSAFYFFQKAFDQVSPGFTEADLLKNDSAVQSGNLTEYITGTVLDKAAALLSDYKVTGNKELLKKAIHIYELTDGYFDKQRSTQYEMLSKLFWKTSSRRLYEQAISACYSDNNIEKAFYFFEKSRSVLLLDEITQQSHLSERDMAKQAMLKRNIFETNRNLEIAAPSSKENLALQQQLFTYKQELQLLINNTGSDTLMYAKNNPGTVSLNINLVRKKILNNSKTLVEIFVGDSSVYILSITPTGEKLIKVNHHLYDSLTNTFNALIADPAKLNKNFSGFVKTSHQLYNLIFSEINAPGGSLIISPDGKGFPFEALIINEDKQHPEYLLSRYATSYTYSASYLTYQFTLNTGNNNVLGIAPVLYKNYSSLANLEGSDNSLKIINDYFSNADNYVLDEATKNNFLQHLPDYAIIQLYAHAADSSVNNDPVIYFSDSALYLSGLLVNRKPVTQLVVLSACETASGKLYEGEGIFSFNRGFAALGIPAAVSNLWPVDNVSTYKITELFYKYLSTGLPTDVALQKAKLEFINLNSSTGKKLPYYWAGTILTGKVDTIASNKHTSWKTITAIIIAMLALGFFSRKYFLKDKRLQKTSIAA